MSLIRLAIKFNVQKCFGIRYFSNIRVSFDNRYATIQWDGFETNGQFIYPLIWLRDNCHATSSSRTINWTNFSFENARLKSVEVRNENKIKISKRIFKKKKNYFR